MQIVPSANSDTDCWSRYLARAEQGLSAEERISIEIGSDERNDNDDSLLADRPDIADTADNVR